MSSLGSFLCDERYLKAGLLVHENKLSSVPIFSMLSFGTDTYLTGGYRLLQVFESVRVYKGFAERPENFSCCS
jgi:hypothetical protein